eukprot:GHVU01193024.1.p1 GENE.GHVU01193024.1~~GHVU01193024.1.p1  ORF type:complete len:173 (+),score=9.85 GHVU01193024.1:128-646(+)
MQSLPSNGSSNQGCSIRICTTHESTLIDLMHIFSYFSEGKFDYIFGGKATGTAASEKEKGTYFICCTEPQMQHLNDRCKNFGSKTYVDSHRDTQLFDGRATSPYSGDCGLFFTLSVPPPTHIPRRVAGTYLKLIESVLHCARKGGAVVMDGAPRRIMDRFVRLTNSGSVVSE